MTEASMSFILFGGGGHAQSVAAVLRGVGGRVEAVADPLMDASAWGGAVTVLPDDEAGVRHALDRGLPAVVAVGDSGLRRSLAHRLLERGLRLPPVAASTATVAGGAHIGQGSVVLEHAHVGPSASVGVACIVNTAAVVEHHCTLHDAVHLGPAATLCGGAACGEGALVGAGATVVPHGVVGTGAVVGAGAVVVTAVPDRSTVVGVPAAPLEGRG